MHKVIIHSEQLEMKASVWLLTLFIVCSEVVTQL